MFRAGLSGTNWTGKTETISRFVREHPGLNIEIISLSALVDKCPFPMEENQTIEASMWMTEQVRGLCEKNTKEMQLFDRTPIDILAYTLYAENKARSERLSIFENILELVRYFDTLFYLPVSNEWPVNAAPSQQEIAFALEMDSYIRKAIDRFELDVVSLPWDICERQRLLSEYLAGSPIT
jgi:predicted ATPase